jgi:hypothetical protein
MNCNKFNEKIVEILVENWTTPVKGLGKITVVLNGCRIRISSTRCPGSEPVTSEISAVIRIQRTNTTKLVKNIHKSTLKLGF